MRTFVGTSGYSYKEWKGSFYPEKLPAAEMLRYYAERFSTVEINNTFYRMPKEQVVESWAAQVPAGFRFVLKASQRITHQKRLANVEDDTNYLLHMASVLGERQGPLLFQLPPNLKKDLARLKAFLSLVENRAPSAFEFRHESWFDDEVYDCLRSSRAALCIADVDEAPEPALVTTADWGYLRLRRENYNDRDLSRWVEKLRSTGWQDAYVYFKHEAAGIGPKLATRFIELSAG
jgi:uncharacterized protein YecE (DUF72 family)